MIITGAGFVIGFAEALIYFNLGKSGSGGFSYKLPPRKEMIQTAVIVLVTSVLTAALTKGIEELTAERQSPRKVNL